MRTCRLLLFPLALASCTSGAQPLPGQTVMVSKSAAGDRANSNVDSSYGISQNGRFITFNTGATNVHPSATAGTYLCYRKDLSTNKVAIVTSTAAGLPSTQDAFGGEMTPNGRWCTFVCKSFDSSDATPEIYDIYRKDMVSGDVLLVSKASDGTQANANCFGGGISADGRFISFTSAASSLAPGETNPKEDVFVKDVVSGSIFRVSDRPDGTPINADVTGYINGDGLSVVLQTSAALMQSDTHAGDDVYVKYLGTGKLALASLSESGRLGNHQTCDTAGSSQDGRFIAFSSTSDNLVPGDTNLAADIFVKDMRTGYLSRASVSSSGLQANKGCIRGAISADGRFVLFTTAASNLVSNDTNGKVDAYLKDMFTGECRLISVNLSGVAAGINQPGRVSADGSVATFASVSQNITDEPTPHLEVFARGTGFYSGPTTLSLVPSDLFIGQKVTLTATLRDKASHDGIAGEEVIFMVDSQVVGTATTNAYGVAKLAWIVPESFALGSHTLFASFAGDLDHARGDSEKFVAAQPGPVILTMPDKSGAVGHNVTLVATLKNAAHQPLPGRTIEFRVDGALVGTGTTDGTGKATYTYLISVGTGAHELTAYFHGGTKHVEQTATATLTVT